MIKLAMSEAGLAPLAVGGLLVFVAVFVGVVIWALTRRGREIREWSSLPLVDGYEPLRPRRQESAPDGPSTTGGCGKCDDCTCESEPSRSVAPHAESLLPVVSNEPPHAHQA